MTSLQNAHCAEVDGLLATALHNLPTLLLRVAPSDTLTAVRLRLDHSDPDFAVERLHKLPCERGLRERGESLRGKEEEAFGGIELGSYTNRSGVAMTPDDACCLG